MSYNSAPPTVDPTYGARYTYIRMDVGNPKILDVLSTHDVRYVYHLAAETHVDKSFRNSVSFSESNVVGTHNLLECVVTYGKVKRFLHMSTDEVYGQVFHQCNEKTLMNPTNPYAATKCGAEYLVSSYGVSYNLDYVIVRGNNVYGPRQYPDKLIPTFIMRMLDNRPCEIHGGGRARRHFVYVDDVCHALALVMSSGKTSEVYNIASPDEFSVLDVYDMIHDAVKPSMSKVDGKLHVKDRPFNDMRYDISSAKLQSLGWRPKTKWRPGLHNTLAWYRAHGKTAWPSSKDTWLVYGAKGWIGQKYVAYANKTHDVVCGKSRVDNPDAVRREMDAVRPSRVVCIIGRTHGPGCGTIDWLEDKGRLVDNVRDNLFGPMVLAQLCQERKIHLTYMGTGCIFMSTDATPSFIEDDVPNFFGSSYSVVKGFTDRLMHFYGDTVLNCRIRMPISSDDSPRNFITKITTYEKICSVPNSMTVLEEMLPLMISLAEHGTTGTFNMTNPGTISHNDILAMYKAIVDPTFTWTNFSTRELLEIL